MSDVLFLVAVACLWALTARAAWRTGARAYQIDLRVAYHQGRDVASMVESMDGYGDE